MRVSPSYTSVLVNPQDPSDLDVKLLGTSEAEGSIRTDQLRKKLKLETKENNSKFHRSLSTLESYALIIGVDDPHPVKPLHANIWQTWDTRTDNIVDHAGLSYREALTKLLEKTIGACVLAREDQVGKWFRWSADMQAVKEELLLNETILRTGLYLVSSRVRGVNN